MEQNVTKKTELTKAELEAKVAELESEVAKRDNYLKQYEVAYADASKKLQNALNLVSNMVNYVIEFPNTTTGGNN